MVKKIAILGSTGSIGRQTLEVCKEQNIEVSAVCCLQNVDLLQEQIEKFHIKTVAVYNHTAAQKLRNKVDDVMVLEGMEGLEQIATMEDIDCVITAMVGSVGLKPTLKAIRSGKRIGLANKETLVCAGHVVMSEAQKYNAQIIPVDSEHSAIFQCLQGNQDAREIRRLILTCSGGPFFGKTSQELESVKASEALKHPNWKMGAKITIDCATLMNKGLEVIEAMHLYQMPIQQVDALIHRQSIIHSMVEFQDGAVLAQLGVPNMKLPIQYALTYPARMATMDEKLDFMSIPSLTFHPIDDATFRCYSIARKCASKDDTACAIMNAANEEAVYLYLNDEIGFKDIPDKVEYALNCVVPVSHPSLDDILEADRRTREFFGRNSH